MAHHFYVYYRVRPDAADAARACVARLQSEVERKTGIRGRRIARCDEPELWMEVYENVSDRAGFEAVLDDTAGAVGLDAHLVPESARKVECFRD
jgi:Domain of unknown function (DUF4936)